MVVTWSSILGLFILLPLWAGEGEPNNVKVLKEQVIAPPESVIQKYRLDPFYKKYLNADGIAVTSSEKVADAALHEVHYLIRNALQNRQDILKYMSRGNTRIIVIGADEEVSKIPEYYISDPEKAARQNRRVRGYGGRFLISCGEENLLNYKGDRYVGENIFLHEFAHSIHSNMRKLDPNFQDTLDHLYSEAKKKGLWEKTYAGSNASEYWAEGLQDYWDCNRQSKGRQPDGVHNHVNTREELKEYDPELFAFIDETLKPMKWRHIRYIDRQKENRRIKK
jgi:alpha-glucosidase